MAWARRCDVGCETWPDDSDFKRCPVCGEKTDRFSNGRPLDMDEAQAIKRAREFEHFYARWCKDQDQPVEGDLPSGPDEAKYDDAWPDNKPGRTELPEIELTS